MYSDNSNQNLFINKSIVSGLRGLNLYYDTNIIPSFNINDSGINYIASQPIRANLSLGLIGNSNDPFIDFTGNKLFSGRIEYSDRYINFESGALTSYNLKYSKNSPVEVSINAVVYGNIGLYTGNNNIINYSHALPIYNFHYVDIDLDEFQSNLAESFEIKIDCERNETYEIGQILPTYIQSIYPIKVSLNCGIEIDQFNYENIREVLNNLNLRKLNINLKNLDCTKTLRTFDFKDLVLLNKGMSLTTEENGKADLNFVTFIVSGET